MPRLVFPVVLVLILPSFALAAPFGACDSQSGAVFAPSGTWTRARFVVEASETVDDALVFDTPVAGVGSDRAVMAVFLWSEDTRSPRLHLGAATNGGDVEVQLGSATPAPVLNAATPCVASGASVGLLLSPGTWTVVVMTQSESGRVSGSYAIPGHAMDVVETGVAELMGPETMTCDANARFAFRSEIAVQALVGCETEHATGDPVFFLTHIRRARDADHEVNLFAPNGQQIHVQRPNVAFAWRAGAMPGAWDLEIPRWVTSETGAGAHQGADSVIGVFAGVPLT